MLVHKDCGGEVTAREDEPHYVVLMEDGLECDQPVYRCATCGQEILGDSQVEVTKLGVE